ncbi:MAG: MlaC/ttg2D family ABC transporter substrate-binding protein [Desulfobaccales bacterium]
MNPPKKLSGRCGLGLIMALAIFLTMGAPGVRAAGPQEDIKNLIEEVQTILQTKKDKPTRLRLIEQSALRRLDYQEMSRHCLDKTWGTINQAQRSEFIRLFTQLLRASHADKLDDFAKCTVTYQGETQNGDAAEVRILVVRTNDKIPVKFQLLKKPQGWMIHDLVIEDVSLVENLRTEFDRIIRSSSFSALLKCMQLKLQANLADLQEACPSPAKTAPKPRSKEGG